VEQRRGLGRPGGRGRGGSDIGFEDEVLNCIAGVSWEHAFYKATIESMARLSLRAVFGRHEKSFASFLMGETDKCETILGSLLDTVTYHGMSS